MIYLSPKYLRLLADAMEGTDLARVGWADFDDFLNHLKFMTTHRHHKTHAQIVKEELRMVEEADGV